MPERWLSENAVTDLGQVRGKIAVTTLKEGSLLQSDMIVDQPALRPGQQEVAIMIDAATGVAGKITPGSSVNVYATFEGSARATPRNPRSSSPTPGSSTWATSPRCSPTRTAGTGEPTDAVPITFALSTIDAQRITYAESFAQRVRLALVAPGGDTTVPDKDRTYELAKDK
ncbi:RcpC/CpaB family pilus assembly protein [Streptomyces thinghirensis]|nr:RcpC/CpaB family pilus assembly protein [Streptomyces thinghirensis]